VTISFDSAVTEHHGQLNFMQNTKQTT